MGNASNGKLYLALREKGTEKEKKEKKERIVEEGEEGEDSRRRRRIVEDV